MKFPKYLSLLIAALLVSLSLSSTVRTAAAEPTSFSEAQKSELHSLIRDYLISNPEIIVEVMEALDAKQKIADAEQQKKAIATNRDMLFHDTASYVAGNSDGNVTIVEFFDYQCGYCKKAFGDLMKTVEEDGNIRLVFKEFPILGPESVLASHAAIAAMDQGKYLEFHAALMGAKGALDETRIFDIAEMAGLDVARLKADMKAREGEIDGVIDRSYELARALGVEGTPAFVVGDQFVPGAVNKDRLKEIVEEARTGCISC